VITLAAIGEYERATILFNWICDKRYDDGSFWMGVTFPEGVIWPEERTTWTAAAVLLAYDALYEMTPAASLFRHRFWQEIEAQSTGRQSRSMPKSFKDAAGRRQMNVFDPAHQG
jgi:hypothetical protein